jgi:hypothetical protein
MTAGQDLGESLAAPLGSQKLKGDVLPSTSRSDDLPQGQAVFTEGEIPEEEEEVVEVDIADDEMKQAVQWTILARFYSMRIPNHSALYEDMSRAWRLRSDMSYTSLHDNLFIITFKAEGDYKFVIQGGP